MGHLRRRKLDGGGTAYVARYRAPNGRERSKQFARRADAERFLAVAEVAKAEGSWVDPARGRMRLRDWVVRFQESERHALRPSTLARDEVYVRTRILPAFGEVPLARISTEDVQAWVNRLATQLAPTTVHKCHQILRKTLAGAVRNRLLPRNPCEDIRLPRVQREETRVIGPAEIRRLADTIDPRYAPFVLLGAYGGLRLGELVGLRWRRVDLGGGRVEVAEISVEVHGAIIFGPPKTNAGRRTVPIPDLVIDSLEAAKPRAGRRRRTGLHRTRRRARQAPAVPAAVLVSSRVRGRARWLPDP
jgi:integrase